MPDDVTLAATGRLDPAFGADGRDRTGGLVRAVPVLATFGIAAVFAAMLFYFWPLLRQPPGVGVLPTVLGAALTLFLSVLPGAVCVVQNTTKRRQLAKLDSLSDAPVGRTTLFRAAHAAIGSIREVGVDAVYGVPILVFGLLNMVAFAAVLLGYRSEYFAAPSVLLGGLTSLADAPDARYQIGTFEVVAVAFLASYVYSLGRLLDRINNNDLYPISVYYYACRAVVACVAAAVLRHTAAAFGLTGNPALLLAAFAVGFAPDLYVLALLRSAFRALKVWGAREDPAPGASPPSMPLLAVDDLTREKIDRLGELGIDSAHFLAKQNPFLLLPRVPYDLAVLVDWIAQAQLYAWSATRRWRSSGRSS